MAKRKISVGGWKAEVYYSVPHEGVIMAVQSGSIEVIRSGDTDTREFEFDPTSRGLKTLRSRMAWMVDTLRAPEHNMAIEGIVRKLKSHLIRDKVITTGVPLFDFWWLVWNESGEAFVNVFVAWLTVVSTWNMAKGYKFKSRFWSTLAGAGASGLAAMLVSYIRKTLEKER